MKQVESALGGTVEVHVTEDGTVHLGEDDGASISITARGMKDLVGIVTRELIIHKNRKASVTT